MVALTVPKIRASQLTIHAVARKRHSQASRVLWQGGTGRSPDRTAMSGNPNGQLLFR